MLMFLLLFGTHVTFLSDLSTADSASLPAAVGTCSFLNSFPVTCVSQRTQSPRVLYGRASSPVEQGCFSPELRQAHHTSPQEEPHLQNKTQDLRFTNKTLSESERTRGFHETGY